MKIIHLILGKANPNRMNGVNRVVNNLAIYQAQAGYEVEVWGITSNLEKNYPDRNYKTELFLDSRNKFSLDKKLRQAIEAVAGKSIGFHIHGAFIAQFYVASRLLAKHKISYIYTPHGAFNHVALQKNRMVKKIYFRLFEKTILENAAAVHFLGKSEFENIDHLMPLHNKFLLPNGQNFEELVFDFEPIDKKNTPVFGFCGRLDTYYKGLDMLLEGFMQYRSENGTAKLWLIGDGEDRPQLEQLAQQFQLGDHVTFFGSKYGQEKLNLISNMDAFVHPSRSEGSPTAVIEASALQIPCLVSTGTNVGELVEQYDCGIHIRENSPAGICRALHELEKMYHNHQLKGKGTNALKMVHDQFDWTKIAVQLAEKLREN